MLRLLPVQIILASLGAVNAFVSGLFASNFIGATAMSAVALYDPITKITTATGMMLTAGSAIVCGKYMGRHEREKMQGAFSLDMFLAICTAVILTVAVFMMGAFKITGFLTHDEEVAAHLHPFLIGQAIGIIPLVLGIQLSTFLSLENKTRRTIIASIVFIIANAVFCFIFVDKMQLGAFGLAISSSLGQWLFFMIQLQYFFTKDATLKFSPKDIAFSDMKDIIIFGIPGALSFGYQAIRGLVCNALIGTYVGSVGLSAFGACNSLLGILWGVPFGMVAVTRMMISVSVGEEDRETMVGVMKVAKNIFIPITCVMGAIVIVLAVPLTGMFYHDPSDPVFMMTVWGFRILPLTYPLGTICIHFVNYGDAMNKHAYIHILSIMDGFICVCIFTALFVKTMGLNSLYWGNVFNGVCTTLFIIGYAWYKNKRFSLKLNDLMVIPDSFGVSADDSIDISVDTMDEVCEISQKVQSFCERKGIDERRSYLAGLALEEMAGNIVDHGFTKDKKKHSIDVRVVHKGDDIILRTRDDCVPFNPGERLAIADPADPASNIGLKMIFAMASDIKYQSILGMNVLTIRV